MSEAASAWLAPTPLAADGAPHRVDGPDDLDACAREVGPSGWPFVGRACVVDDVAMREVTFAVHDDDVGYSESVVMLHLNGLTDAHRDHVAPALLTRRTGTPWRALTYLLPEDGAWSYRFVVRDAIPDDVGASREGWIGIHRDGRPDPRGGERLRHPHGQASSVYRAPASPRHPAWDAENDGEVSWETLPVEEGLDCHLHRGGSRDADLLVLFDAEQWSTLPVAEALRRRAELGGSPVDVVLVESGGFERRSQTLPDPERAGDLLRRTLAAVAGACGGPRDPERVVVAGQSYGGLAAAGLVVHHPELTRVAIVQSGSFWHEPGRTPSRVERRPGRLTRHVADLPPSALTGRRLVAQVGTDEGDMALQTRLFAQAATDAGAEVSVRQYRGGHDYAWWSHALLDGLDVLGA